jgi:hypothetical protein
VRFAQPDGSGNENVCLAGFDLLKRPDIEIRELS